MSQNDIFKEKLAEIDERIEFLQSEIDLNKDLEVLHEIPEFQRVILDAYLDKESKRIYELLTTPTSLKREQLENLNDKMTSIRDFKGFFKQIIINATMAPEQIEGERQFREEVTAEASIIDVQEE